MKGPDRKRRAPSRQTQTVGPSVTARPGDVVLAVDPATRRPLCALLQAACGGDHHWLSANVSPEKWQEDPGATPKLLRATPAEWRTFLAKAPADGGPR